jgi:predicted acyl esterase
MRRIAFLPAAFVCLAAILPSLPAHANSTVPGLSYCAAYGQIDPVQICSGEVPSWDGASLDVDLTLPATNSGSRHPLIVMLHGFANNKHEWESKTDEGDNNDKWHWNNHWFAEHGFYVLTYTARGFFDNGPSRPDQPATPSDVPVSCAGGRPGSACLPNGTIHLKSREFEIRDTQWLSALVAAAYPDLDTNQVAVTGGSYGGGESWLQASQPVWDVNSFVSPAPTPALPVLHLQVVIPKYPWSDLGYSLGPNGHPGPLQSPSIYTSSVGDPFDPTDTGQGNPFGNVKFSYTAGFFFEGVIDGIFENFTTTTPSEEGPISLPIWANRALVLGDPYDVAGVEDPVVLQLRRGLTEFRGAYYQDDAWLAEATNREVAIFSISGWTDDLFPPVESFRAFKLLKSLDRLWPVEVAVADVGHPRAQNPDYQWHYLNQRAWGFLNEQIHGSHRQQTDVFSLPTVCDGQASTDTGPVQRLTGRTPEELASGTLTVDYETAGHLLNRKVPASPLTPDPSDPDNLQTDPAFGSALLQLPGCRQSVAPLTAPSVRYTGVSEPLDRPRIYVGLGQVDLTYTLAGASTATLNARVWDVAPDGRALLVTRGTYRIDTPAYNELSQTIQLPLFGNQWTLEAGHKLRLDLTQVDYPTFLQSNSDSAVITFPDAHLVLPTREATDLTLLGAAPPLP